MIKQKGGCHGKSKEYRIQNKNRGKKARYGWVPDPPDHRYIYGVVRRIPAKLPSSVDLRSLCSKVEDQGNLGSCTDNALVGSSELLNARTKSHMWELSRLFYYNERVIEHSTKTDSGAMISKKGGF